jgi:glycosyltransferase involved in cell wall biosynthesis
MKILFITQKIDPLDPILGFVCGWLRVFANKFKKITVICLEKNNREISPASESFFRLPTNVTVLSLGKERRQSRFFYLFHFYGFIWRQRKEYDGVFVHMNSIYVILGFIYWKLTGRKIVLWYNHTTGGIMDRLAFRLADQVCHTSPYSFSAGRKNSVKMPAGIDPDIFYPKGEVSNQPHSLLFIGRISPVKNLETLLAAAAILTERKVPFFLNIYGRAAARDCEYFEKTIKPMANLPQVRFLGEVPNFLTPDIFNQHTVNVNLTPRGNYDKTVLEAMACGTISLVSSPAFASLVPPMFTFQERNPKDLAQKIEYVFSLSDSERERIGAKLRRAVIEQESLPLLADRLLGIFSFGLKTAAGKMKNQKLIYLANARLPSPKAHAIQIAKMSEAFLEEGADLTLLIPRRGGGSLKNFYGLRLEIPTRRLPVLPLYEMGKIGYYLATASFMIAALIYLWWLKLKSQSIRLHLIDMDQLSIGLLPFLPFPVTLEIHDAKPKTFWFNWIFKNATSVLTINNLIKEKITARFGLLPERVLVFPNGIDPFLFNPLVSKRAAREKLGLPIEKKMVMYTGQFYGWKGLEIFPIAAAKVRNVLFYLVGGTEEEFAAVTGQGKRTMPANMRFLGKRPFTEIPFWLRAADAVVVLGTKRDEYSFYHTSPMKLFESMAAAAPIVAARTPAITAVVTEKEVFFYEPDDAASLAAVITQVIGNEDVAAAKTAAALAKVNCLTWRNRVRAVINQNRDFV